MQDRYVGDLGDFGKYGLLRSRPLRRAGRTRGDGPRSIRAVRERGVLPLGTAFFEELLSFAGMPAIGASALAARLDRRARWLQGAIEASRGCDLVFADPDNGIECGRKRHEKLGPKHAYFDELAAFVRRGQRLIVYHHLDRSAPAPTQIAHALDRLARGTGASTVPFALHFRRGTARAFLVVPSADHNDWLIERARRFAESRWGQHSAAWHATARRAAQRDGRRLTQ